MKRRVGDRRGRRTTRSTPATGCSAAGSGRRAAGASCSPTRRSGRCYGGGVAAAAAPFTIPPGEEARRWPRRALLRGLAEEGMDHDDHVVALGGGVVGDLAGFCAAVYQRGVRRGAGPDDARRPGRLRLRRQDRRGPPGGQELRRRLPPAARRARRPARARDAAAGGARRGLGRGDQDRADRRRPAVGARARAARRTSTATSCSPARARSSPSWPRDERDGGRRQVLNLGHTVGHAIETATGYAPLPPRRGGRARPARRADALRPAGAARGGRRAARGARGLPTRLDAGDRPRARSLAAVARDKKRRGGRVGFVARRRAGRRAHRRAASPSATSRAAIAGADADEEPRRRPARRQPRRARPPPGRALRRAHVHAARAADRRASRASSGSTVALLPDQLTRASSSRSCTSAPRLRGRAGAQPGRVDALRVGAARRGGDRRAAGGRGAPLRRRRPRGVPARLGARRRRASRRVRARASTATARRSSCSRRRWREPRGPRRRPARRARARRAAGHRPGQPALPDRLHRLERRWRVVGRDVRRFVTDFRYVEQATAEVPDFDREQGPQEFVRGARRRLAGRRLRLGFDDAHVSRPPHRRLRELLPGRIELVPRRRPRRGRARGQGAGRDRARSRAAAALADELYAWLPRPGSSGAPSARSRSRSSTRCAVRGAAGPSLPLDRRLRPRTARCRTPQPRDVAIAAGHARDDRHRRACSTATARTARARGRPASSPTSWPRSTRSSLRAQETALDAVRPGPTGARSTRSRAT